jgi:hypothetical protein
MRVHFRLLAMESWRVEDQEDPKGGVSFGGCLEERKNRKQKLPSEGLNDIFLQLTEAASGSLRHLPDTPKYGGFRHPSTSTLNSQSSGRHSRPLLDGHLRTFSSALYGYFALCLAFSITSIVLQSLSIDLTSGKGELPFFKRLKINKIFPFQHDWTRDAASLI